MKTRMNRYARSAFALILAICMLLSCVMQSGAAMIDSETVGWGVQGGHKIYFINTGAWSNVYQHFWGNGWGNYETMTQVANTGIYYKSYSSDYTADGFNFDNDKSDPRAGSADYYDWVTSNAAYSGDNAMHNETDLTKLNGTAKIVSMIEGTNGSYTKTYNSNCVATVSSINLSSGSTSTSSTSGNTGSSSEAECYPAYGATVNYSATAAGAYEFKGFSTTNSSSLPSVSSTMSTISTAFNGSGNPDTVYAYFASKTYNISFSQPSNGSIKINNSTSSPVSVNHGSSVSIVITPNSSYKIKTLTDNGSAVSAAVGKTTAYTYTISNVTAAHTIVATMEAANTPLSAPTNVMLNGSAANCSVTATTVGAKINLTWDSVTNAGSYKIYKGDTLVTTVNTTSYSIERAYSSNGKYTVVAVPSDTNAYSESPKSTGYTLTVSKKTLTAPTVTVSPTDIALGSTVDLTATDMNSGVTVAQYSLYYYESTLSATSDYLMTSGTAKTITPATAGTHTYKVVAYPLNGSSNDYYTQSSATSASTVTVYANPAYKIAGGLAGTNWNYDDGISFTNYAGEGVYYFSSSSQSSGDHYFKFYDSEHGYSGNNDTNNDCVVTLGESNKYGLVENESKSFKVTGSGVFVVYFDVVNTQIWVDQNTWTITPHVYYQSYNLVTDSYNNPQDGTTGGTISPNSETLVTKGSSTTLIATAASGYTFDGWYNNSDFASGHKVSSNASYTFTPSANGDYYALFKKTVTRKTITLSFDSNGANVSVTYNGTTKNTNGATISVPVGASVTYSISAKTGYQIDSILPSGLSAGSGNTFTMPNSNTTITVTTSMINYDLNGVTSPTGKGTVKFYSNSACTTLVTTANYGNTVYAKYDPGTSGYVLKSFSVSGTGASLGTRNGNVIPVTVGSANVTVTATVILQYRVTYYVDMHDNSMSGKTVQVAIVTNGGGNTVKKDANNQDCSATLTKQGDSTVYAATINTPVTQSGSSYSDLYVKVTYTGKTPTVVNLPGTKVATLVSTHEMWLEAENEASTALKVNYDTNATPTVADGNRRIYLAKPYSWQSDEPTWENIGIYHWGNYNDIGWNAGTKMHYLGNSGSDGYHYYYVDIPKAIDGNKVSNIIFQGWGSNQSAGTYSKAQTGNIENIPDSANFFYLSKDDGAFVGTKSEEDAIIPNYTRYVNSVAMNLTETTEVSVKPTYTGEDISYTSSNPSVVTVDGNGNITPVGRGTTTITVKIYGTIGSLVTTEDNDHKDYSTYPVSVTVKDPTQFNGFEIMSLESKTYTVNIPAVSGNQPGYFDMSNVVMTVEGIHGVASSTSSAIITQTSTTSVTGVGTVCTAFTVQYAKANSLFENYGDINIIGKVTTKSIARSGGQRYGHESWEVDGETEYFTTSRTIANSVETATTNGIPFDDSKTTYSAIFAAYNYVDVTFTFNYEEYNPKVVDGKIQYPYDSTWAAESGSHTTKTVTVSNYEVRELTADNISSQENDYLNKLVAAAGGAIVILPKNNYYNYNINGSSINVTATNAGAYTAAVTVNLNRSVRTYSVYRNGNLFGSGYTYQQYADIAPSGQSANTLWYAVDTQNATDTTNAPLLATGSSYKFRVKGDTYLRTKNGTIIDADFNRSEVDFSHYEVTHQGSSPTNMKEYLMQNFYIADFFSPSKVLDPNSNNGQGNLPYDDAQFVGGGVVYYSVTNGAPFANAISSGYVGNDGKVNANAIKEMLKANIEAQYNKDNVAGTVGEDDAMKAAYGTEIEAKKNVEGGFNTGIIYRYLPLNEYKRDGSGNLETDGEGKYTLAYDVNNNTFRYSNTLQSYQYVYASGNENKATNAGKNMRLYSYYVYSYVAYNQETNVPETRYEIVLSDNYSDASTYWGGSNN